MGSDLGFASSRKEDGASGGIAGICHIVPRLWICHDILASHSIPSICWRDQWDGWDDVSDSSGRMYGLGSKLTPRQTHDDIRAGKRQKISVKSFLDLTDEL